MKETFEKQYVLCRESDKRTEKRPEPYTLQEVFGPFLPRNMSPIMNDFSWIVQSIAEKEK